MAHDYYFLYSTFTFKLGQGMKFDDDGQRWRVRDLPKMGGLALVRNGDQVIDALGLSSKTYNGVMWDLATVSAFNLVGKLHVQSHFFDVISHIFVSY